MSMLHFVPNQGHRRKNDMKTASGKIIKPLTKAKAKKLKQENDLLLLQGNVWDALHKLALTHPDVKMAISNALPRKLRDKVLVDSVAWNLMSHLDEAMKKAWADWMKAADRTIAMIHLKLGPPKSKKAA